MISTIRGEALNSLNIHAARLVPPGMPTPVFLTIDTEFAWRHHAAGLDGDLLYRRSIEPAGVGLTYQLDLLGVHGLKACFFVDPMPALIYGISPFQRIVAAILAAG